MRLLPAGLTVIQRLGTRHRRRSSSRASNSVARCSFFRLACGLFCGRWSRVFWIGRPIKVQQQLRALEAIFGALKNLICVREFTAANDFLFDELFGPNAGAL